MFHKEEKKKKKIYVNCTKSEKVYKQYQLKRKTHLKSSKNKNLLVLHHQDVLSNYKFD